MNQLLSPGIPSIVDLQVQVQTHAITASKCISNVARSQRPTMYPASLGFSLKVCMIMTAKCISKHLLNYRVLVHISQLDASSSPIESPHSLYYRHHVCVIMAVKCISQLAPSQSSGASLCQLNHSLEVYLHAHFITASMFAVMASKCISKLA